MTNGERVLKEHDVFLVADAAGSVATGAQGVYACDTRFLSEWRWTLDVDAAANPAPAFQTLVSTTPRPDRWVLEAASFPGEKQEVHLRRVVTLEATGMRDAVTVEPFDTVPRSLIVTLTCGADFVDLFEVRGFARRTRQVDVTVDGCAASLRYVDPTGIVQRTRVTVSASWASQHRVAPQLVADEDAGTVRAQWRVTLQPGERLTVDAHAHFEHPLLVDPVRPSYQAWRAAFVRRLPRGSVRDVRRHALHRAVDDLRALTTFTRHGPILTAGIPWYVAPFGRDALLSAWMLLDAYPELAVGTLTFLAAHQGTRRNAASFEAPGKILHEMRYGELTRLGDTPFGPFYGSIDATPLWVALLGRTVRATGDVALARRLWPALQAALAWMETDGDPDGDGFLEFTTEGGAGFGPGRVQSWKDSNDGMHHADGSLPDGPLAVSEVQGYAFDALREAAWLHDELGEPGGERLRERASRLASAFHEAFWRPALGLYAMALDGRKRPLDVPNSDAGHLLWSGIVPVEVAATLTARLLADDLWSGWGIRTVARGTMRYNPLSYHVGSVWPHENAMIAAGMQAYGFADEGRRVAEAVFDVATSQPDLRPPELIGGDERREGVGPVPYPVACRPQAWDAAALVYAAQLFPDLLSPS